ncbi:MAG: MCE family protein [Sedimentisphaerales bacterium]|nr:MCE family protein [Sedimentisphaerales bacterium]
MGTKPNYFKIGLFVIAGSVLILTAVVVLGAGLFQQDKSYFETYFDESISGLSVGSPVEFRGVRIGDVEKISFIGDEYDVLGTSSGSSKYEHYVMVLCSIPRENLPGVSYEQRVGYLENMVSRGLRIRLTSNILTGQAYLQADFLDPKRFQTLDIGWQPEHLYIPSAPSELMTLKDSVDKVLYRLQEIDIDKLVAAVESVLASLDTAIANAKVGDISQEARELLAEARKQIEKLNTEKLSLAARQTLTAVDRAVGDANVPALSREIQSLIVEVRQTNANLQKLLASPEPVSGPSNLPEMIARLNKTLYRIDKLISTEKPQIEVMLANFKEISDNLKRLTENLKQHPSDLLFSKPPPPLETLK